METVIMGGVLLVVALVAASGVWVGSVLIAAVTHVQRPASSTKRDTGSQAVEPRRPS